MRGRVFFLLLPLVLAGAAEALTPPPTCRAVSFYPDYVGTSGGASVILSGERFTAPLRVFFGSKESFVVSRTDNQVVVVSPAFDVREDETLAVPITMRVNANTPNELSCSFPAPITVLAFPPRPEIIALAPSSGSIAGDTIVTIFGDWFDTPLRVFFSDREAQVISVNRKQLRVIAPAAGSEGPADVRVVNVNTSKDVTLPGGYRYRLPMTITSATAARDRLTIRGTGFYDPVIVTVEGQNAQVLRVDPDRILAVLPPLSVKPCTEFTVIVTNVDNGETAAIADDAYHCGARDHEPPSPQDREP